MSLMFCSLFSGSSGNSSFIGSKEANILVDAGLTGKAIEGAFHNIKQDISKLDGILITHEHTDHIKGAGVLSRRYDVPVYANAATWEAIDDKIGDISLSNIRVFENDRDFYIKDVNIQPFNVPHDAVDPVGFCLYNMGKKICIVTDLGYISSRTMENISDADILILEANYDEDMLLTGSYPYHLKRRIQSRKGHLSNEDAGSALIKLINLKLTHVLLGHLSQENNQPELAYNTVLNMLLDNDIKVGRDVILNMTYRDRRSSIYRLR